jgi:hypothetical protein
LSAKTGRNSYRLQEPAWPFLLIHAVCIVFKYRAVSGIVFGIGPTGINTERYQSASRSVLRTSCSLLACTYAVFVA